MRIQKVFPKLQLFNGRDIYTQNFDGQTLKDAMLQGLGKDIVYIPADAATAVQQQYQDWAKEVMPETWQRQS